MIEQEYINKLTRKLKIALLVSLAFLPFAIWLVLIDHYGVNFPIHDQWDTPRQQLVAYFKNEFNLEILFRQHNESRKVFPILIFMIFPLLTGEWNTRWEMFLGLGFAGLMSLLVLLLLQRTNPKHLFQNLLLVFFYNCLLLSFRAYFRWLNGITLHRLIPDACLLFNALVFTLNLPPLTKTFLFAFGAVFAQYSFASGILIWFLSLPLLLALNCNSKRQKIRLVLIYGVLGSLSCGIYFWNYHTSISNELPATVIDFTLPEILRYSFAFLGNLLTNHDHLTPYIGFILTSTFLFLAILCFWRQSLISSDILPWLIIGIYPIILAFINAITRLPMGEKNALAMRYLTHLPYLPLAIAVLAVIISNQLTRPLLKFPAMFLVGLMFWLYLKCNFNFSVFKDFSQFHYQTLQAKACVQLSKFYYSEIYFKPININSEKIRLLDEVNLLKPGVAKLLNIDRTPGNWGTIEVLERTPEGIHLEGWAVLKQRPADALVILQEIPNQPPRVVDIWATGRENDIIKYPNAWWQGGWEGTIETARLSGHIDLCTLNVYGFETEKNQLLPLKRGKRVTQCQ